MLGIFFIFIFTPLVWIVNGMNGKLQWFYFLLGVLEIFFRLRFHNTHSTSVLAEALQLRLWRSFGVESCVLEVTEHLTRVKGRSVNTF